MSSFSNGLGGVSKVYPIGSFVRLTRKLSKDELLAVASDPYCPAWDEEMNDAVGEIGIVLGGGVVMEMDAACVGFAIPKGSVLGNYGWFHNNWLEPVALKDVPAKQAVWLCKYMEREMRLLLCHTLKNCTCQSKFGACGTLVRVCPSKPKVSDDMWLPSMDQTLHQFGVVVGGRDGSTVVAFGIPIFFRHQFKDEWLTEVHEQSLDNLTLFPEQYDSLCQIRQLVVDAEHGDVKKEEEEPSLPRIVSRGIQKECEKQYEESPFVQARFAALEARILALENELEQRNRMHSEDND